MEPDFSGWATKNGLKCSDGRTIMSGAFKHNDKQQVPLVWQHMHSGVTNVLGHGILEERPEGVYVHGFFNDTPEGQHAKVMVQHKDITSLSIYASGLVERNKNVSHGDIKEVSLVLSGANPGALIDNVSIKHGDTYETIDEEALIFTDEEITVELKHEDKGATVAETATTKKAEPSEDLTVKDVYETFTDEQLDVVHYLIGEALADEEEGTEKKADDTAKHADDDSSESLAHKEGTDMTHNIFDQNKAQAAANARPTLSHSQIQTILDDGVKLNSLKESFLAHADEYGIKDIELMFPDARLVGDKPELLARQAEWVPKVLNATKHSPFAKIKSLVADITAAEARAKGYVTGAKKTEEVLQLLRRTTGPTTVYKKQKLDRDDILDITDFDVIAWLKWEIRFMLDEEIARAILIGDGRSVTSPDKIKDPAGAIDGSGIRSIALDDELYAHKVELVANVSDEVIVDEITRSRSAYRGSGTPTLYTTDKVLTGLLLLKDKMGRRLYDTESALAAALRVKEIVAVEVLEETPDILAIIVNLVDYTIGANKGGEVTFFSDFDIDFNQEKYLMETRISGALTKPKSAIVVRRAQGTLATVSAPSFDGATNTITVPTSAGVDYSIDDEVVTGEVEILEDTTLVASPKQGYYFPAGATKSWTFAFTA